MFGEKDMCLDYPLPQILLTIWHFNIPAYAPLSFLMGQTFITWVQREHSFNLSIFFVQWLEGVKKKDFPALYTMHVWWKNVFRFEKEAERCQSRAKREDTTSTFEKFFPLRLCEACQFVQTLIHFLGPLWCQKTNRLSMQNLVINFWKRATLWTEWKNKGKFPQQFVRSNWLCYSLLCVCILLPFQLTCLFLAQKYPSAITVVTCLWAVYEVWEQRQKACLISATVESGDVFISFCVFEWIFTWPPSKVNGCY